MTNTRITDAEVFERRYPVILRDFSLRRGSGGAGLHRGGDGVIRDIEFRHAVEASILSERRVHRPYGLHGGADASCGVNHWIRRVPRPGSSPSKFKPESSSASVERTINLGAKNTATMQPGDRIVIYTPGGGGWGASPEDLAAQDHAAQDHAAQDHAAQDHAAQDHAAQDHAAQDHAAQVHAAQDADPAVKSNRPSTTTTTAAAAAAGTGMTATATEKKNKKWDPASDPKHSWRGGSLAHRAQLQETS